MQTHPSPVAGIAIASVCLGAAAWLAWPGLAGTLPCDGRPVAAYTLRPPTIESVFAASGVLQVQGVEYRISDGIFKSLHGVRAWVAVKPRAARATPEEPRFMLLERDGQVFCGTFRALASQHANHP